MTPEMIESTIESLANKLAVPVDKLLIVLPQIGYKMIGELIVSTLVFLCIIIIFYFVINYVFVRNLDNKFDEDTTNAIKTASASIMIFIFLIEMFFVIIDIIINSQQLIFWLLSPEAWALDYILKMIQ